MAWRSTRRFSERAVKFYFHRPRPTITPAPTPSPASCTVRAYESVGCDCDPKSTCEGGMHDGSDEACCGTNGGYCGVEWRGTDGAEWIDIHDDACSGTDFFRVSPGCGIEVKTEWGETYLYNEGSVLVCGYECECRATPGCDTVRYLRIYATGPAAYDQGDEDECEGDEDDDDDWDEDEDEDCDIETSDDRSSSPSGTTNHGAGKGWCYSALDDHVGCAASPGDCWAMCLGYYGDGLVAIDWNDDGDCYCQNDCECMEEVFYESYLITRDSRVGALPHECGHVESSGCFADESGSSDDMMFSYFPGPATHASARAACQALGGDLASIHSAEENAAAFALTGGKSTRIGLTDAAAEGTFVWDDGTPLDYEAWNGGEPNSSGGDEDCVGYLQGAGDRWHDIRCDITSDRTDLGYICRSPRRVDVSFGPRSSPSLQPHAIVPCLVADGLKGKCGSGIVPSN